MSTTTNKRDNMSGSGITITEIIEEVRHEFCRNYCKYTEECDRELEEEEFMRPCPLDKL